jgi:hypothetical protein
MHEKLWNRCKDKTHFGKYFPYEIRKTFSEMYVFLIVQFFYFYFYFGGNL